MVLEITEDFVNSIYINNSSTPNIFNILNKSSTFIKNNNNIDNISNNSTLSNDYILNSSSNEKIIKKKIKKNDEDADTSSNNSDIICSNDPPLIPNIFMNNFNNKVIEIN
jgi:hypothetical protein